MRMPITIVIVISILVSGCATNVTCYPGADDDFQQTGITVIPKDDAMIMDGDFVTGFEDNDSDKSEGLFGNLLEDTTFGDVLLMLSIGLGAFAAAGGGD